MIQRGHSRSNTVLRNRRFQLSNACVFAAMGLLLLVPAFQTWSAVGHLIIGTVAAVLFVIALRAFRAATLLTRDDELIVRSLLTTRAIKQSEIESFGVEVGPVVVLSRAYLVLARTDGRKETLMEFFRPARRAPELETIASSLTERFALGAGGARIRI